MKQEGLAPLLVVVFYSSVDITDDLSYNIIRRTLGLLSCVAQTHIVYSLDHRT
jgi:hypothetical protein